MICRYCRWSQDTHNVHCPNLDATPNEMRARLAAWQLGFRAGRTGSMCGDRGAIVVGKDLIPDTWRLGEIEGNVALEETENGC